MNFEILVDTFYFCNKLYSYFINIKAELSSEMSLLFAPIKLHFDYCIEYGHLRMWNICIEGKCHIEIEDMQ